MTRTTIDIDASVMRDLRRRQVQDGSRSANWSPSCWRPRSSSRSGNTARFRLDDEEHGRAGRPRGQGSAPARAGRLVNVRTAGCRRLPVSYHTGRQRSSSTRPTRQVRCTPAAWDVVTGAAQGPEIVYLFWPTIMAYLRIATHPTVFRRPAVDRGSRWQRRGADRPPTCSGSGRGRSILEAIPRSGRGCGPVGQPRPGRPSGEPHARQRRANHLDARPRLPPLPRDRGPRSVRVTRARPNARRTVPVTAKVAQAWSRFLSCRTLFVAQSSRWAARGPRRRIRRQWVRTSPPGDRRSTSCSRRHGSATAASTRSSGCPRQYAFRCLCRLPAEQARPAADFGTAAHGAFEAFTRERRERHARGEPPPSRADLELLLRDGVGPDILAAEADAETWPVASRAHARSTSGPPNRPHRPHRPIEPALSARSSASG